MAESDERGAASGPANRKGDDTAFFIGVAAIIIAIIGVIATDSGRSAVCWYTGALCTVKGELLLIPFRSDESPKQNVFSDAESFLAKGCGERRLPLGIARGPSRAVQLAASDDLYWELSLEPVSTKELLIEGAIRFDAVSGEPTPSRDAFERFAAVVRPDADGSRCIIIGGPAPRLSGGSYNVRLVIAKPDGASHTVRPATLEVPEIPAPTMSPL
jgi:uncharacterized protein (DUF3084 family)